MKNKFTVLTIMLILFLSCRNQSRKPEETIPKEKFRPEFHFTPPEMWMNDPNGMVYYDGEYHLFYQYNPDSLVWGIMHWGHAVSKDLIHWEHLPIALYPDENGWIYSGSAVIDWENTSGLGSEEDPPMIAIFTLHDMDGEKSGANDYETQAIAYSLDKGRNWSKYDGNPVILNPGIRDFRDPKVFWNEETKQWTMVLAVTDHINFYTSPNLIEWELESDFGKDIGAHGGVWECPDLFKLPVEGTDEEKWVLLVSINPGAPNGGSGTQYFVGEFDGSQFVIDESFIPVVNNAIWIDYGTDNYAGVTYSDIPEEDGRRIFIGWMSNWQYANVVPTEAWRSAMTIPRELKLEFDGTRYLLKSSPVNELSKIYGESKDLESANIGKSIEFTSDHDAYELVLEMEISGSSGFELLFSNDHDQELIFGLNKNNGKAYVDRTRSGITGFEEGFAKLHYAPYKANDTISLQILIDVASIEVFADNGKLVMTEIFFPESGMNHIEIINKEGVLALESGKITRLKSIESKATE